MSSAEPSLGHQQFIGIRGHLEDLDAHVVDHLDDVFDLVRIRNVFGEVIVHLGIGQVALFLALGDQAFEAGLLVHNITHSLGTFDKIPKKKQPAIIVGLAAPGQLNG